MAKIDMVDPINFKIESQVVEEDHRGYLGISQMGHECDRYLYYVLHDAYRVKLPPRVKRIFQRGDWEEARIVHDLGSIGCTVWDEQKQISLFGGLVKGHIDGKVVGVPGAEKTNHLLEIKTMADTYWQKFRKEGIKKSNFGYYIQGQLYAIYEELDRILFVATNKNTEERCFERVHVEPGLKDVYEQRMIEIIAANEPPERKWKSDWYLCKFCNFRDICHFGAEPNKVCRSCKTCSFDINNVRCNRGFQEFVPHGCTAWESCVS